MQSNIVIRKYKYKHFSEQEREILALRLTNGKTQKEIAKELNRSPSTISREIFRNGSCVRKQYMGSHANKRSNERKRYSHAKDRLKSVEIRDYVEKKLRIGWTPEALAGRIGMDIPGARTNYESIYLYIYNDKPSLTKYLPRSHRKRFKRSGKKGKRRSKIPNRVSIEERPTVINMRSRLGDWEADTMISRSSSNVLLVLRERKSQITLIKNVRNKSALEFKEAAIKMLAGFPQELRRSITFDNGTENTLHEDIAEKLNLDTFFCNPYHSWEKGSVENTNGLIRRYLPKKTDFSLISERDIKNIQDALNNRPRKSLRFLTPYEFLKDCA